MTSIHELAACTSCCFAAGGSGPLSPGRSPVSMLERCVGTELDGCFDDDVLEWILAIVKFATGFKPVKLFFVRSTMPN